MDQLIELVVTDPRLQSETEHLVAFVHELASGSEYFYDLVERCLYLFIYAVYLQPVNSSILYNVANLLTMKELGFLGHN